MAESGAGAGVRLWGRRLGGGPPEGPGPEAGWGGPGGAWCMVHNPAIRGLPGTKGRGVPPAQEACRAFPQSKQHPKPPCLRAHEGACGDRGLASSPAVQCL